MQKTILIGRVGKELEKHTFDNGQLVKFPFAVSEKYKDNETTEWFNIIAYNKVAEIFEKYVTKRQQLYLECKRKTSVYEKDGQKRYNYDYIVVNFEFIGSKPDNNSSESKPKQQNESFENTPEGEDEMPF